MNAEWGRRLRPYPNVYLSFKGEPLQKRLSVHALTDTSANGYVWSHVAQVPVILLTQFPRASADGYARGYKPAYTGDSGYKLLITLGILQHI